MFGINGSEFVVLLVVAAVVLGPERLPQYAQQLARLVRELRRMAQGASQQMRDEMGPEFDEIDWRKLDPRQYDPRRIVREALSDSVDPDDPLGLRGAGVDRRGLGLDREGLGLDDEGVKPVSPGGPGARRPRPAPPRQAGEPGTSTAVGSNGTPASAGSNGSATTSATPAAAPLLDDVPLDPDAT
ncbi:MAG: Sec-independent protein translocase TatB [Kineosporiaceae bacterium]